MCSFSLSPRHLLVVAFFSLSLCALATGLPEGSVSVTSVTPNTGDYTGGKAVTIAGTGFVTGASVTFGGIQATGVAVIAGTISCTTPPHAPGAVDVTVTNLDTSHATLQNGFTYTTSLPAPTVSSLNPTTGPTTGGTSVTLTGTGFATSGVVTVTFDGTAATGISVGSSSSVTCITPAHNAGAVDVVVINPDTQSSSPLIGGFTYTASAPKPTVTGVSPSSGPIAGGTGVTITGTNFVTGATVTFDGTSATGVSFVSATTLNCTTPAHAAGSVPVVVTNPDAQTGTLPNGYTYTTSGSAPTVTTVAPGSGTTAGGTTVNVTGTNFVTGATVTFDGTAATGVAFGSATSLTCTTPAHAAGSVPVVVTNPDAQSGTLANAFTYTNAAPAPVVLVVSPNSGPTAGGTGVTVTGAYFVGGATVFFGGTIASGISFVSANTLTCTTPAHAAGAVDVVVTNADAQTGKLSAGYTYVANPCTLTCAATVPSTGQAGKAIAFQGSATPTSCTGQPAYQWTFGDGKTAAEQNPSHSYDAAGTYSWSLTASLQQAVCTEYGSIAVSPAVPPPVITAVVKAGNPFRLKVSGSNFHVGCTVKINGVPVPTTKFKSVVLVVAKSGAALKAMVPVGVPVQITVTNNDDGGVSTPFSYTR